MKCNTIWLCMFVAVFSGIALTSSAFDGGVTPCSGLKSTPCGSAVDADEGCVKLADKDCDGEILTGPYTSALGTGQPANNMKLGDNWRVCVYQFECAPGIISGCRRGDKIGDTMTKEVVSGGNCVIANPVPQDETR